MNKDNEQRVIHIPHLKGDILGRIQSIQQKFGEKKRKEKLSTTMGDSATFLFETRRGAEYFRGLLDEQGIAHFLRPASDYENLATQGMDFFTRTLRSSFEL